LFSSKSIHANAGARRRAKLALWALTAWAFAILAASPAQAHGFGQRYDLPLPFSLYLFGTATAIVVSFVIVGLFMRGGPQARTHPRIDLLAYSPGRLLAAIIPALQLLSVSFFVVVILAGLFGNQNPYRNIAPTFVWVIFWVGLTFVSALIGDLWALINPWRTLFAAMEWFWRRCGGRELSLRLPYPAALGVWPAVLLLFGFGWIELVYPNAALPAHLAVFAIAYSTLTWTGMALFGRETWLQRAEVFSVVFGLIARFAPTDMRCAPGERKWELRPPGAGLLDEPRASPSVTALVLLILSTVLFDGLLSTPEWSSFESALRAFALGPGAQQGIIIKTIGLVGFWLIFLAAYWGVSALMSAAAGGVFSPSVLAGSFALTLIPIAIGYHVAHYLPFLLIQGQYLIPLLSDPFGFSWDLFGTAGYRVDIAIIGARFEWYTAVSAILVGHIAAVYLAHVRAMQLFGDRAPALRSQVPLTALMVVYTFVSLSILAEPIVQQGAPAQPSAGATTDIVVPDEAVLPEPGSGRLQSVGPGNVAKAKLTYRVLGSAFHDGTKTSGVDLLYAYIFAYRWGVRREGDGAHYDPYVDAATAPIRAQLAGLRVVGADPTSRSFRIGDVNFVRELLLVDVYTTIVPQEPERDGVVAPPWSTLPWHLVVLMEEAVERGWAAFSQAEAARRGIEWLDLVRSEETNRNLASLAAGFERDGYRPETLQGLVNEDEARKRWAALNAFYKTHAHFLVTNGPYHVKKWSGDSVVLEAFRDLSYPLGVGSYDAYAIPRRGFVTKVEWDGDKVQLSGEIELVEKFQRSYRLVRAALPSISPVVLQRAAPECRYVVIDGDNRVAAAGFSPLGDDASFRIDFRGRLPAGRYTMFAVIAPNGNVMNADVRRIPFVISSRQ
jgi:hypothetical protein